MLFIPYKIPERDRYQEDNLIRLEVEFKEWSARVRVIEGKEYLENFLDNLSDKNISRDTVNIIGNTPFKSISTFVQGITSNNKFIIYVKFVDNYSNFNDINFEVYEWYPKNKYIKLYDSIIWYKLKLSKVIIISILLLIIILIILKINNIKK